MLSDKKLYLAISTFCNALVFCFGRYQHLDNISRQRYFDMQLAATMLEEGIVTILTENTKDFAAIEGISAINPFSASHLL